jgi:hypothetical protein
MIYTVEWTTEADDDLMQIWMDHQTADQAINAAVRRIDYELSGNAHRKGVRLDNYRYFDARPLRVLFEAIPDDNRVLIIQVRWIGA